MMLMLRKLEFRKLQKIILAEIPDEIEIIENDISTADIKSGQNWLVFDQN